MPPSDLSSRAEILSFLRSTGIRPRKRLGQNFLADSGVLAALLEEVRRWRPHTVLEIGAGLGTVTARLASIAQRVVAVEVDTRLLPILRAAIRGRENVEIHPGDILSFDIAQAFAGKSVSIVGNLPYRITAPILKHLIAHRSAISHAVLMTQQEVAAKIIASPGPDGSALGVLVRAYADVSLVRQVPRQAFYPVPNVDSALWTLSFLDRPRFSAEPTVFFQLVRLLYGKRRKMIRRVLRDLLSQDQITELLKAAEISPSTRGETLGFEALDRLATSIARNALTSS